MTETPTGQRYSHVYQIRGVPVSDSEKFRFRLSKLAEATFHASTYDSRRMGRKPDYKTGAIEVLERELGIRFSTQGSLAWSAFFSRITVTELLDSITILASSPSSDRKHFIASVARILSEENVSYWVDPEGGMHPLIDPAFTGSQSSAISALNGARYAATAESVHAIDACLIQAPPDYRAAIRLAFGACENLFKLMYSVPRLDAKTAFEKIGKDQQALYDGRKALMSASSKTLESFKDWIDAAHFYRHEEGVEEPSQPTEEFAVLLISQGLSFVRWLASIDRIKQAT